MGELDGKVVTAFIAKQMKATRRDAVLDSVGIASVGVLPEFRNRGAADAMMRFAIDWMRGCHYSVSSLYAFRESYYRKFGWEAVGNRVKVKCPTHRFPAIQSTLPVRQTRDWRDLQSCYEAFAKRFSGMNIRQESFWKRIVDPSDPPPLLYAIGDPVQAYCVFRFTDNFWDTQDIAECAWNSPEAYDALLQLFKAIGANKTAIAWLEPRGGLYPFRYADQGVELEPWRPIMFRVVDVPNALAQLRPNTKGEFTIEVHDEQVPQNRGPWKVVFEPAGVRVEKTDAADLSLTIQRFTQAFLGEPSLQMLADEALIQCHSQAALHAAQQLLTPTPVYCMDFF